MSKTPTVDQLIVSQQIQKDDIEAAIQAYLAGEPIVTLGGYEIDLAAAVDAHAASKRAVADETATESVRKSMVRAALVLAKAVER